MARRLRPMPQLDATSPEQFHCLAKRSMGTNNNKKECDPR